MRKLVLLGLSGALFFGCGDDDSRPDGGTADTGGVDSRVPDTGGVDAPTTDAPTADVPTTDTGGGGMCPPGACDLLSNMGCAPGEGCYLLGMEGMDPIPTCAMAGTVAEGGECPNANDCQEGHICIIEGSANVCRKICCGGDISSCTTPGSVCLGIAGVDNVGLCEVPSGCDIITQMGCGAGESCTVIAGDGSTGCVPTPADGGRQGDVCNADMGCFPGFLCLGPMGSAQCSQACNPMAAMPDCADGTMCNGVTGFPETLGGCVPMM